MPLADTRTNALLIDVPERFDTERLTLRCPRPGDGEMVFQAVSDSLQELRQFPASMSWAMQPPSVESSEIFCREAHARFLARSDLPYIAFGRDTGELVVATGLHRPDWQVPKFEIGFWRRSTARSHGFATEAVGGLVEFALSRLGAMRLEALVDDENLPSCALCERLGMTREGVLRNERKDPDGRLRNTRVYAIVADAAARL
jgi:RimJ/RimL family protein N-acetyltransferase